MIQNPKFGHFDDTRREYVITDPKTPWPWINYLGNEDFFSLISNTAGGYSFYKDAKFRRLTRYRYNNVPMEDRKSTRLNSSHANISYAVFCLKKKKSTNNYFRFENLTHQVFCSS